MVKKLDAVLDIDRSTKHVKSRESMHREFKSTFDNASLAKYAKTMAAMANTHGGTIYFGIADRPNRVVGIDRELIPDEANISNDLENWFEPHIAYTIQEYTYSELTVMGIEIKESPSKPIICKKNKTLTVEKRRRRRVEQKQLQILTEGTVYRRYSGKTEHIKFPELLEIFEQRDQRIYATLLENLANIQRIGAERVGIADVTAMGKSGEVSKIYLSKEAIKNLNLIDKGKFVETEAEGDPAYFIAGSVNLHETTEVPVDDEDRIKPGAAAKLLQDDARKAFFPDYKISPMNVHKFATINKFRGPDKEYNNRYCKWDEQAESWFYREAFVRLLRKNIIENPRETLEMISSAKNLELFDKHHQKDTA